MTRRRRILKWMVAPVSRVYVAVLFVLLCFVAGGAWKLITNDEHSGCVIQARGLPASHHLASAMSEIGQLLSLQTPAQLAALPPHVRDLLTGLHADSHAYGVIEAKQPMHRSC